MVMVAQGVPGSNVDVVVVEAINVGKRPTQLSFLALVLVPSLPWYRKVTSRQRKRQRLGLLLPRRDDLELYHSTLPAALDVAGSARTFYRRQHVIDLAKEGDAVSMYGIATTTHGGPKSNAYRCRSSQGLSSHRRESAVDAAVERDNACDGPSYTAAKSSGCEHRTP
jgi:hypothetical protein